MKEKQDMTRRFRELAGSYVPEWKFDMENPDIGTALALVYGEMMESVEERYSHMMEKKRIDFLNSIGADLSPATTAKGYVSFGLSHDLKEPVKVPAKTYVTADSQEAQSGQIYYETKDDVLVMPARLLNIYEVNERLDYMGACYEAEEQETEGAKVNTFLFQNTAPDLQEHELYIGHSELFAFEKESWFELSFFQQGNLPVNEELLRCLADPNITEITYYSEEGFVPFQEILLKQGKLQLHRKDSAPLFCKCCLWDDGKEQYYIRIRAKRLKPLESLHFRRIEIAAAAKNRKPELVIADGMEADLHEYFPFGERLSVYNEVYFASNELLGKHGATIQLNFHLRFATIPLDTSEEPRETKWEWVMREEDFEKEKEFAVSIASVIWEYYNGTGWARLFPDNSYDTVFTKGARKDGTFVTVSFQCPMDMEQAFMGSVQAYAIRARITKLNNPYKLNGFYVSPVLDMTSFSLDYSQNPIHSFHVVTRNSQSVKLWKEGVCVPFKRAEKAGHSLYLGFDMPLQGGPVKLYFQFREAVLRAGVRLVWEYWNGKEFQVLHVIDETSNFSKSGLVTFLGPDSFQKSGWFGKERYWIRIVDSNGYFDESYENRNNLLPPPFLEGVILNTVKIENREPAKTEYFQMEYYVKHKRFRLQQKNIQSIHVYIKEGVIGKAEPVWKEWTRVPDFLESGEQSEHYMVNQNEGVVQFGDGNSGKVPPVSREDNIKILYQCGGGQAGNVDVGEVERLTTTIRFIQQVSNPLPMSGGLDKETKSHAIRRCSSQIRLHNRAVTIQDYEALALEASRRIEKVKCFRGIDGQGKTMRGAITLALLIKDYKMGSSVFQDVKNQVMEYLKGKMPDTVYYAGKLFVVEPVFVICHVKAILGTDDFQWVFSVQKQAEEQLNRFFDPLEGNVDHQGWEMGTLPKKIQLQNMLFMIEHVTEIKNLLVRFYRIGSTGYEEVTMEEMEQCPFTLPVSGTHHISIEY